MGARSDVLLGDVPKISTSIIIEEIYRLVIAIDDSYLRRGLFTN